MGWRDEEKPETSQEEGSQLNSSVPHLVVTGPRILIKTLMHEIQSRKKEALFVESAE